MGPSQIDKIRLSQPQRHGVLAWSVAFPWPTGAEVRLARAPTGCMGKLMLGLAMAAVVFRSYIGLSPWKLALLLLSLFMLNLLQVGVRGWRGKGTMSP